MKSTSFTRSPIALMLASALALPVIAAHAQNPQLQNWDASRLYRNTWSAEEMIDTDVRGQNGEEIGEVKDIIVDRDGNISRVVVEVGGILEIGDQHIGVPWKDVRIGQDMEWVQVPLREVEDGTYSLYGRIPQGEDVAAARGAWRVNELIGDYASLRDIPRYGLVTDVLFNDQGKAQGVIINRTAGAWGRAGWYGYPYSGYYPGAYAYPLPYDSADVGDYGRFSYVEFAQQSEYAGDQNERVEKHVQIERPQQQGGASAGGGGSASSAGTPNAESK